MAANYCHVVGLVPSLNVVIEIGEDDLIARAVSSAGEIGGMVAKIDAKEINEARAIANAVQDIHEVSAAVEKLLAMVIAHPNEELLQHYVARVFDRVQDPRAYVLWQGIAQRFPRSDMAFLRVLRWKVRLEGIEAGRNLFALKFPECPLEPSARLQFGRCLLELKDHDGAEEIFARIAQDPNAPENVLVELGRLYVSKVQFFRAVVILKLARERFGTSRKIKDLLDRVEKSQSTVNLPDHPTPTILDSDELIELAFTRASAARRSSLTGESVLRGIVLINGSLGAGGSERQLVYTALGLQEAASRDLVFGGCRISGPVSVICRSLHSRAGADFFRRDLIRAGIAVHEYMKFEEYRGDAHSHMRELLPLLVHLPPRMQEGVVRLTDHLVRVQPDVVHIWQDGSALATSLAAIAAGTPRIVVSVRSLPPCDRPHRAKPEYAAVYRALLNQPNTILLANSCTVASRYEDWLQLEHGSVRVVPNGLRDLKRTADEGTLTLAASLEASGEKPLVVGSVFRFDENKRPLVWLDVAREIFLRNRRARFVLVGDGPLLGPAVRHARALGLEDRVIFTGSSTEVGFWLPRMDAFLLLSRHEGLPNALIEAQLAGVPVVTTPAGGAGEAIEKGITGALLNSSENVDVSAAADTVLAWLFEGRARQQLARKCADWAHARFSYDKMLHLTLAAYMGKFGDVPVA